MVNEEAGGRLRIDKWLWHARFFKSRSLAAVQCRAGRVRINGEHCRKASATVSIGDTLTIPKPNDVKVVEILALGVRRGPASEAAELYKDLTPPQALLDADSDLQPANPAREKGMGRPTKTDRRAFERLRGQD